MRLLKRNLTKLYVANYGLEEQIDADGNYTGVFLPTEFTVKEVNLSLYTSNGEIIKEMFGDVHDINLVAISSTDCLSVDSRLYKTKPTLEYYDYYDYTVTAIAPSLNHVLYGLKGRI